MTTQLTINGLPKVLKLDAWWMAQDAPDAGGDHGSPPQGQKTKLAHYPGGIPIILALVVAADVLFWQHDPGISVALFALAFCAAILASKPGGATKKEWMIWSAVQIALNLPVVEFLQTLSVGFTILGIVAISGWVAYDRKTLAWQSLRLVLRASTVGAASLPIRAVESVRMDKASLRLGPRIKALILPVIVGLVFLLLLAWANPILEDMVDTLTSFDIPTPKQLRRIAFWGIAASFIWPYLNLRAPWLSPMPIKQSTHRPQRTKLGGLLTQDSARNSLFLFNALFLAQTSLDIGVLSGGATLPDGMSYAQYAHRGAYPLAAAALLAGVFATAFHRMTAGNRMLRGLLYLWLGQTLFLVLTAAYRLGIYVDVFSLTYLRVRAFIWMALVFVGLILIIVKIAQDRDLRWLIRSILIPCVGTLYFCCFVNFAYVIAEYNARTGHYGRALDPAYLCTLGPQALPVILERKHYLGHYRCRSAYDIGPHQISEWQEWGFRKWRLQAYLAAQNYVPKF